MSLHLNVVQRQGYTLFDVMSDIGGMQGILFTFMNIFLNMWNYRYIDDLLVSKLFRSKEGSQEHNFTPSTSRTIKYFCLDRVLPARFVCCRKTQR